MQENTNKLFDPIEVEALSLLLAGELPILKQLRAQIEHVVSVRRTFTTVGFYLKFELTGNVPDILGTPSFAISDVSGPVEGTTYGVGFVLFIKSGRLHFLEGATFGGEEWPTRIAKFSLGYDHGERDWAALQQSLSRASESS
jgi:hypothetical protein